MFNKFGSDRVIEFKGTVPTVAWKLDNSLEISDNEMLIRVDTIKLEESNFRQICNECEYNKAKIGKKIKYIVNKRGKLHNPVTNSGGICSGRIVRAGSSYSRSDIPDRDPRVICATSLTSLPMYIESVEDVDFNYSLIVVKGYVIAFESTTLVPLPEDIKTPRALSIMDEMGSMKKAYMLSGSAKKIFILGDGLLNMLFYTAIVRKAVGRDGYIVAAVYKDAMQSLSKNEIKRILKPYADHIYFTDILKPLDCYESFRVKEPEPFDLSINCTNMLGGEVFSVMLTKSRGEILFTSLISNFNSVALFSESLGKELRLTSIEEFSSGFVEFNIDFIREIKSDIDMVDEIFKSHRLIKQLPMRASELHNAQNIDKVEGFVFGSNKTKKILMEVINIAAYDCNVIIQGETGTGKEKILNLIHKNSIRKTKPCIKINCATIYENLAESEFFGYEPGSFTGAGANRKLGYFELANGGILFLDEIGELSLNMQSKLLRALQEKNFYRVGGQDLVEVDVRVICANNVDLRTLVKEGKFREDLYYRLSVCEIKMPPLRERNEDIACIAEYLINEYNFQYNTNKSFSADSIEALEKYNWPGNVRELDNVVHRLVVNCESDLLTSEDVTNAVSSNLYKENPDIPDVPSETDAASRRSGLKSTVGEFERDILAAALEEGGSTRAAAKALGISQSQVMRKKKKYNL